MEDNGKFFGWVQNKDYQLHRLLAYNSNYLLNLDSINNSEMQFKELSSLPEPLFDSTEYSNVIYDLNRTATWSNFYRDAVDHLKRKIGSHQVKAIRLKTNNDIMNKGGSK